MNITYSKNCSQIDWLAVRDIIKNADWGERPIHSVEKAFSKSSYVRFAYDDDKLIGFGRTVDDGVFYAWVVDLVVIPEYQNKGIGSHMLKELEMELETYVTTMLTAVPGKCNFYKNLGWLKQTSAFIRPRNNRQRDTFTENS